MPARPFSKNELRNIVSNSTITNNFRHLLPISKRFLKKSPAEGNSIKAAPARDRIKWWNVVPGDQVRVMGDREMPVREVLAVNKVSNRVFLQSDKKVCWSASRNLVCSLKRALLRRRAIDNSQIIH